MRCLTEFSPARSKCIRLLGPTYASVTPFEIGPRSRIVKDSFPRLTAAESAGRRQAQKTTEQLLQCEIRVTPRGIVASQLR